MKSVKNLLVPFIVMVALIIVAAVYFIVDSQKNVTDESENGLINVVYINTSDILNVTVFNQETGYTSRIDCNHQSDGVTVFEFKGDDAESNLNYSQYELKSFVENFSNVLCRSKVSDQGNYAEYGLDVPAYTITITSSDRTETKLFIGNISPNPQYCYFCLAGSKEIYLLSVDKLELAKYTSIDFLEEQVLEIEYSELDTVDFSRRSDGLSLKAAVTEVVAGKPVFEIIEPYSHPVSSYFSSMIEYVGHLHISDFVQISDDEKSKYGLSLPEFHFSFKTIDGTTTDLFFGKPVSDYYYGYIVGSDYYFRLSKDKITGLNLDELKLIDPYIFDVSPSKLSSLTCNYGEQSFKLDFHVSDGSNLLSPESEIKLDGRNAKITDSTGRSYSSILFESITSIEIAGICDKADVDTSMSPDFSISFISNDYATTVYEFYARDKNSFFVFKNGIFMKFYVFSEELFNNGGADTYNYGCWAAYKLLDEAIKGSINGVYDIPRNGQNDGN